MAKDPDKSILDSGSVTPQEVFTHSLNEEFRAGVANLFNLLKTD